MERLFGGNPGLVLIRLVVLSLIVGVLLAALGFSPFDIIDSVRRLIQRIYDMGFAAVEKAAATSCSAPSSCSDLADRAPAQADGAREPRRSARHQFAQPRGLERTSRKGPRGPRIGTAADEGGKTGGGGLLDRLDQRLLDAADQRGPLEDEPGIELEQRGARFNLGKRRFAGVDAAHADQRQLPPVSV